MLFTSILKKLRNLELSVMEKTAHKSMTSLVRMLVTIRAQMKMN